jgi:hypothetical protein
MGERIRTEQISRWLLAGIVFLVLASIVTAIITMIFGAIGSISLIEGHAIFTILLFFLFLLVLTIAIGYLVTEVGSRIR